MKFYTPHSRPKKAPDWFHDMSDEERVRYLEVDRWSAEQWLKGDVDLSNLPQVLPDKGRIRIPLTSMDGAAPKAVMIDGQRRLLMTEKCDTAPTMKDPSNLMKPPGGAGIKLGGTEMPTITTGTTTHRPPGESPARIAYIEKLENSWKGK